MRNLLLLLAAAILLPGTSSPAQITVARDLDHTPGMDSAYIREIKLWKSLGDLGTFKSSFASNVVITLNGAPQTRDQFFATFKHCNFGPINLQNHNIQSPTPDTVTVSYRLHIEMNCNKQPQPIDEAVTTTWVHIKGDKWLIQSLVETPVKSTQ